MFSWTSWQPAVAPWAARGQDPQQGTGPFFGYLELGFVFQFDTFYLKLNSAPAPGVVPPASAPPRKGSNESLKKMCQREMSKITCSHTAAACGPSHGFYSFTCFRLARLWGTCEACHSRTYRARGGGRGWPGGQWDRASPAPARPGRPRRPHRPEPGTGLTLPRTPSPPQAVSPLQCSGPAGLRAALGPVPSVLPLLPLASARASLCVLSGRVRV